MKSLRKRLAGDRGVALPVTVSVMFMVAGLATVTARAAITADHQSLRDRNVKQAIQAANAGLEAAMYRTNLMQPGSLQCALRNVSSGNLSVMGVGGDGWCIEQTEDLGNGQSYSVRVSAGSSLHVNGQSLVARKFVSTGMANGVRRRVLLRANAATGEPVFPQGYAGVSLDGLNLPEHRAGPGRRWLERRHPAAQLRICLRQRHARPGKVGPDPQQRERLPDRLHHPGPAELQPPAR